MTLYLVTSKVTEKDSFGTLLKAKVRCFGIFTNSETADGIASKYDGSVIDLILDKEYVPQDQIVLQQWLNPEYVNG